MSSYEVTISGIKSDDDKSTVVKCFSMHHAIDQQVGNVSADRITGTSVHGPLEFTHVIDAASPKLRLAACGGTNLGDVTVERQVTGNTVETITLKNAYIVRIDLETPLNPVTKEPGDEPLESFAFEYSSITWSAATTNVAGAVTGQITAGYSTATLSEV